MPLFRRPTLASTATLLAGAAVLALAGCETDGSFDGDLRHFGRGGFDTSEAARNAAPRPASDGRGIISYPNYQVAVAQRGDTVASVAQRIGVPVDSLASYNAIAPNTPLREGEVLALPNRVSEPSGLAGSYAAGPIAGAAPGSGGRIDVATLAGGAIDRAETGAGAAPAPAAPVGQEPIRHRVARGETAYSIARLYGVNVKALADWNGLGPDLAVREGQYLMIPVTGVAAPAPEPVTAPGTGSPTPLPPSAAKPLPTEKTRPAAEATKTPPAPDLGGQTSASASSARLAFPVQGKIIREYQKKKNDGIDISAPAGTAVKAAADGTVAAITKDTEQVPILVVRHADNLLTVYANISDVTVKKGDRVKRGQPIAKVRATDPAFVHFEVRQGFDSVDPLPYLQ